MGRAVPCLQLMMIIWRVAAAQYQVKERVWHGWYLLSFGVKCICPSLKKEGFT
jgi:hypothetical protein